MIENHKTTIRHPVEADMLKRALEGDAQSANKVLVFLSSTNPSLRQIMQETIYDLANSQIWRNLLRCFAMQRWGDHPDYKRLSAPVSLERFDQSIIEIFTQDQGEQDTRWKEDTLLERIDDPEPRIRQAVGYLLGLRGDLRAIPALAETIEIGTDEWRLRAIKSLAALADEKCGPPLIKALIMFRGEVHSQASRALNNLGQQAEAAWLKALDHQDSHIRWHAARGLGSSGDVQYAPILAKGLLDDKPAVRWASADMLASLGARAVPATLTILTHEKWDERTRQAAYHALHGIASRKIQKRIKPLLKAMKGPAAGLEAPFIAQQLLMEWKQSE